MKLTFLRKILALSAALLCGACTFSQPGDDIGIAALLGVPFVAYAILGVAALIYIAVYNHYHHNDR